MTLSPIRVLCVDDHAFLVEGLRARLQLERDMEFVGRLGSAENLAGEAERLEPDVVILDIEMPGSDPFDAIRDLHDRLPHARVIMLSAYVRDHYINQAVQAGAWGYLSKSDDPDAIVSGIRRVAKGEFVFGPEIEARLKTERRGGDAPATKLDTLTPREMHVLRLIGRGLTRAQIAKEIYRSPKTVDAHRIAIMQKLDIHDRGELVRFAIREGLVEA